MSNGNGSGRIALVLGATGGIGGVMSRELRAAGWTVRALHRRAERRRDSAGIEWLPGDAMERAELPDVLDRAVASIEKILADGIAAAMNLVNTKKKALSRVDGAARGC